MEGSSKAQTTLQVVPQYLWPVRNNEYFCQQGAIAGFVAAATGSLCLTISSMFVKPYTEPLPPGPVNGCLHVNLSDIEIVERSNYTSEAPTAKLVIFEIVRDNVTLIHSIATSIAQINFHYYGVVGVTISLLVGIIVSAIASMC